MNKEIEIKVRVKSLKAVKETIAKVCSFIKEIRQKDTYYVPTHKDFFTEKRVTEFFRVREQEGKDQVAYHKVIDLDKKTEHSQEYEVGIDDPKKLKTILGFLGFKEAFIIDKHREYWQCGNFEVVLDNVKDLGEFIEVEVINSEKTKNFTKEYCLNFLKEHNISFLENISSSYPELMREHHKKL
ncbi:class IV adenylate cyclase [Candidatus Woesearchaeota archaeon CG10_big_fil_rev_8_21_14_0_10_45_16]|nr:MAG: class IV adenylate cyclase [Candidatus Woesearchaeota archaeon CG10_big_fil_rev_8_21_14_0_10_45_16]